MQVFRFETAGLIAAAMCSFTGRIKPRLAVKLVTGFDRTTETIEKRHALHYIWLGISNPKAEVLDYGGGVDKWRSAASSPA